MKLSNRTKYILCGLIAALLVVCFVGGFTKIYEGHKASTLDRAMKVMDTNYKVDGASMDGSDDMERPYHVFTTNSKQFDCAEFGNSTNETQYVFKNCKRSDSEVYLDEMTFPKTSVTYISVNRR